jgi:hypothetical protein
MRNESENGNLPLSYQQSGSAENSKFSLIHY